MLMDTADEIKMQFNWYKGERFCTCRKYFHDLYIYNDGPPINHDHLDDVTAV